LLLIRFNQEPTMKVQELMSVPAVTCREGDSLGTAASLMRHRDCGAIPVVDSRDAIIGIITDRDICMAASSLRRRLDEIPVAEITNGNVFSVAAADTVQHAARIMRDHRVRRLPVVNKRDRIIGMISLNDIAREGQREVGRRQQYRQVKSDEVLHTLAEISRPDTEKARAIV
jgi:CBS domain-containing protein